MAKKQQVILLHNNTSFTDATKIALGELAVEHGNGANGVKIHARSNDDKLGTFITEAAIDTKINAVDAKITGETGISATLTALQSDVEVVEEKVSNLEATVGDAKSGLVKDVATLQNDVDTVEEKVSILEATVGDAESGLVKDVATNANAIATLNGSSETTGSVAKALADAKAYTDDEIAELDLANTYDAKGSAAQALADAKDYADTLNTTVTGNIASLQGEVDAIEANIGGDYTSANTVAMAIAAAKTTVKGNGAVKVTTATTDNNNLDYTISLEGIASESDLSTLQGKVATLIGDDSNKSAREIANEELAKQLIPANAADALDELKEIAAWIQSHPDDASAMNTAIQNNATAITANANAIATLNGSSETTGSVAKALADAKAYTDDEIAELDLANTYDAKGSAAQALADAKDYADTLNTTVTGRIEGLKITVNTTGSTTTDISLNNNKWDLTSMVIDCGTY